MKFFQKNTLIFIFLIKKKYKTTNVEIRSTINDKRPRNDKKKKLKKSKLPG